ncbi:DUF6328 family protein [Actinoplanes philippinensis]|uniref:DUF6328 family protein n=1 Tax=Actinoplanes philippinensis TaxID=35752 RepID=UPI0033EC8C6A
MGLETEKQRWDRNFTDLLQELRVAQTGVQILFAFLLIMPFSAAFEETTRLQRTVYLVALLTAAFAAAAIISPVAFHRALFRRGRKPELVRFAHRMATTGLACLMVSMIASILLITDFTLPRPVAWSLTGAAALWFVTLWGVLPWARRGGDRNDPGRHLTAREVADRVNGAARR